MAFAWVWNGWAMRSTILRPERPESMRTVTVRAKLRAMETPQVTAYLKTHCGWSAGVRAVLAKYNLPYTEKDIIQNPAFRWEMETKSGQPLSPCVEINGKMVADVSGEDVERYLIENSLVQANAVEPAVPINAPCPTEPQESPVRMRF